MKIHIVTPAAEITVAEAEEVYAYGPQGEFGVLPGHAHYVSPLAVGRLTFNEAGEQHYFMVEGGFLEVLDETVYVLANRVERAGDIDFEFSRSRLTEVEKQLGHETLSPEEYEVLTAERDLQSARLNTLE